MSEEDKQQDEELTSGDAALDPNRPLSPRHRLLAQLLAQGRKNEEIAKELHYTPERVSSLRSNMRIRELAEQIRERTYEETIGSRLKRMAEPALNEIQKCLDDRTNRYKEQLKQDTAKWVLEKLDGKASQKFDLGENMLALVMDRLDAMKSAGAPIDALPVLDVTPQKQIAPPKSISAADKEEEALRQWAADFANLQKP
jgi:hypothetical protein